MNKKNLIQTKPNLFGWCSLLVTIIIAILWLGNTPLHSDDFYYQRIMQPDEESSMWDSKGDYISSVSDVKESITNHRKVINGRGSNLLYIAFQLLPIYFIKYFCGIILALLCVAFWKWSGGINSLKNNLLAIAIPLLLWTAFQWNDQMQSSDFQFNYTLPSLLMVVCLIKFFDKKTSPGFWGWTALAFFSVLHECFTIVFGVFLGVQWLFKRDKKTFIALIVLVVGALLQYTPGTQDRAALNINSSTLQFYSYTLLISKSWVSWVALGWWLIRRRQIDKPERRTLDRFAWGFIASWGASFALIILLMPPQRAHWPNEVLGVALILIILCTYGNLRMPAWVKASLLALYCAWGISLVYWQVKVTRFTNYCIDELKRGNSVIVDTEGITSETIPFWLMGMTRLQYNMYEARDFYSMPIALSKGSILGYLVLPPEQVHVDYDSLPYLEGDTDLKYLGNTLLVRKHDGTNIASKSLMFKFGKPSITTSPLDLIISKLIYGNTDTIGNYQGIYTTMPVVFDNDSLDVIILSPLPRSVAGRPIIAAEWQN